MSQCMKENALYRIICRDCREKKVTSEYLGETRRNCFLRGREHLKGLRNKENDNALWKHSWERHGGKQTEKCMK